jgi:hypothetical protein
MKMMVQQMDEWRGRAKRGEFHHFGYKKEAGKTA